MKVRCYSELIDKEKNRPFDIKDRARNQSDGKLMMTKKLISFAMTLIDESDPVL